MSFIRALTKSKDDVPDAFDELYQRSPIPKNILFSGINTNSSPLPRTVPVSSLPGQKQHIFNQLKEQSQCTATLTPLPLNKSQSLNKQKIHSFKQLTSPEFKRTEIGTKPDKNDTFVTHFADDEIIGKNLAWQNGTFSEDLPEKSNCDEQDEVDGLGFNNNASAFDNRDNLAVVAISNDNCSDSIVMEDEMTSNTTTKLKSNSKSQSAASIFKKIKMLSPSKNLIENQENLEPETHSLVNENSRPVVKNSRYPLDVEVSIQSESDQAVTNDNNQSEDDVQQVPGNYTVQVSNQTIGSSSYKLYNWIIKPLPEFRGICVDGKKNENDDQYFHSSIVTTRVSKKIVKTANGSRYTLVGSMEKMEALNAGISEDVVKAFATGFPVKWKSIIDDYFNKVQFIDDSVEMSHKEEQQDDRKENDLSQQQLMIETDPVVEAFTKDTEKRKTRSSLTNGKKVKEYTLTDWIIKPISNTENICVEGKKCEQGTDEYWHSTAIEYAKDKRTLVTSSGSIYRLVGKICKLDTMEAGFSERIVKAFADGFPRSWKTLINCHFSMMKKQQQEEIFLTPKARSSGSSRASSTVCTPSGLVFELDSIKRSRSGRVVKPALAWWAGQRIKVNSDNTFELSYNSSKTPEILKSISKSYETVKPKYQAYVNASMYSKSRGSPVENVRTGKTEKDTEESKNKKSTVKKSMTNSDSKRKSFERQISEKSSKKNKRGSKNPKSGSDSDQKIQSTDDTDLDSLVEDLTNTVKKAKPLKKRSSLKKKDTCYSKVSKSSVNKLSRDEIYSVDTDTDFDQNKSKTKSKSVKRISTEPKTKNRNSRSLRSKTGTNKNESQNCKTDSECRTEKVTAKKRRSKSTASRSKSKVERKLTEESASSEEEESDEDDFSQKTGTVKAKRTESKISKMTEKNPVVGDDLPWTVKAKRTESKIGKITQKNPVVGDDLPWTKIEITRLNKAMTDTKGDDPNFWELVAQKIKTRNSEQCISYYYKDVPRSISKKKPLPNAGKKTDLTTITAKKGTLKRKQQLREFVEHYNDGYEDDLFDSTPYRKQGSIKMPKMMDEDEDDDIFEEMSKKHPHLLNRIYTPLTRIHLEPVSEKKTPATSLESPWTHVDRKDAEKYIHQVQKRRHLKGRKILDKSKTPVNRKHYKNKTVASPTKNLFGIQNMFVDEAHSSDNYEDSDNDKDYYWSDFEN